MFDITERKLAEERLQKAEANYRTLVEQLPVVVYQDAVDDVSTALYISPQYERLFGFPPGARLRNPQFWVDHLHPEDRDRVLELSKWTNETGEPFSAEYRFIGRDGRVVWVRDEAELLHDADGEPMMWQGVLLDVTARKHAEEALSRRDLVLQAIGFAAERFLKSDDWAAALPDVLERLGTASSAGRVYVFENVPLEDGRLGMRLYRQWFGSDTAEVGRRRHDPSRTTTGSHGGARSCPRDGSCTGSPATSPSTNARTWRAKASCRRSWSRSRSATSGGASSGSTTTRPNASGRPPRSRRSRRPPTRSAPRSGVPAPSTSAARNRSRGRSSSSGPAPSWPPRSRRSSRWTSAAGSSTSTRRPSGCSATPSQDVAGESLAEILIPPELRERHRAGFTRFLETGEPAILGKHLEVEALRADGRRLPIELTVTQVQMPGTTLFTGFIRDLTERRNAELQLREAEQRYRTLVENLPAATYIDLVDDGSTTLYISPQIEAIWGYTQQEWTADPDIWINALHPDDRERTLAAVERHNELGEPFEVEYRFRAKDGRWTLGGRPRDGRPR